MQVMSLSCYENVERLVSSGSSQPGFGSPLCAQSLHSGVIMAGMASLLELFLAIDSM